MNDTRSVVVSECSVENFRKTKEIKNEYIEEGARSLVFPVLTLFIS